MAKVRNRTSKRKPRATAAGPTGLAWTRITSKGQVTVPVAVRRAYSLDSGDEIGFRIAEDRGIEVITRKRRRLTELVGILPPTRPYPGRDRIRSEVAEAIAANYRAKGSPRKK